MRYRTCLRGAQNEGRRQEACLIMLSQARSLGRIKLELLIQATRLLSDVVVIGPTVESGRDGAPQPHATKEKRRKNVLHAGVSQSIFFGPLRAPGKSPKLHTETYYQAFDNRSVFSSMRLHIEFNQSTCDYSNARNVQPVLLCSQSTPITPNPAAILGITLQRLVSICPIM
jgi:hypothetical protein